MSGARCSVGWIAAIAMAACGEDGTTPSCPDLSLYAVHDASADAIAARTAAAERSCVTAPGSGRLSDGGTADADPG